MNNVEIKSKDGITKTYIDGKEIEFVKKINFRHGIDEVPTLTIEFITNNVNISVDKAKIIKNKVS